MTTFDLQCAKLLLFALAACVVFILLVWAMCRDSIHERDRDRLDWLEDQIRVGVVTSAFEIDGGVYLDIELVGDPPQSFREQCDLRHAIDIAMAAEGAT